MPTQMFTCDKCQKPHASEAEAATCEKKHKDFEVVKLHYSPYDQGIPVAITLRFDGGRESSYCFRPGTGDEL